MNDPRKLFVDERTRGSCAFCGARPDTVDHCPSKILLDAPYPANLPVVDACSRCNNSFSADELYVACALDCALVGATQPCNRHRPNVRRLLTERLDLAGSIAACEEIDLFGNKVWQPDMQKVANVMLKLARGHLDYEINVQERGEPDDLLIVALPLMSDRQRQEFENPEPEDLALWPEIGSRAFLRAIASPFQDSWQVVQEGRYRYYVGQTQGNFVHMVLSEYLFCRAVWL